MKYSNRFESAYSSNTIELKLGRMIRNIILLNHAVPDLFSFAQGRCEGVPLHIFKKEIGLIELKIGKVMLDISPHNGFESDSYDVGNLALHISPNGQLNLVLN